MDEALAEKVKQSFQQHAQNENVSPFASDAAAVQFTPLTDCYLNYVYKVTTSDGACSCLVKCYLGYARFLGPDAPIEEARCQREYDTYIHFRSLVDNCCPLPHFCDQQNSVVCIDFLESYTSWGDTLETSCDLHLGAKVADMLVRLHSQSHSGHLSQGDFTALKDRFSPHPRLRSLQIDCHFNLPMRAQQVSEKVPGKQLSEAVQEKLEELRGDAVVLKAFQLTREWMEEEAQCIIHGDLHVQSVMVSKDHQDVKLIDLECARVGPSGYDVALLVCNYLLLYHYHQDCSRQEAGEGMVDHTQLRTDALDLICITLSRYMEGMHRALEEKFDRHLVWRQILLFLGVEIIAWVAGPPSLHVLESHSEAQLNCLNTAQRILHKQSLSLDTEGLSRLIHQQP